MDLERILRAARQPVIRYSGISGRVYVDDLTEAERVALTGLLGRHVPTRPGERLSLRVTELDQAIRNAGIADGLITVLEAVESAPLVTRAERKAARDAEWSAFLSQAAEVAGDFADTVAADWLSRIVAGQSTCLPLLRREFGRARSSSGGRSTLTNALALVGRALAELPSARNETLHLPVFAQRISGDPHALDPQCREGRLFIEALRELQAMRAETTARDQAPMFAGAGLAPVAPGAPRSELLVSAGLLPDEVSSTVITYGLNNATRGDGRQDALVRAAVADRQVLIASVRQISQWTTVTCPGNAIYAVENPAVFEELVDRMVAEAVSRAVICTSGFLSVAAWRLLELAVEGGAVVHYGGDFDVNGLTIADAVIRRCGTSGKLWRMGIADYEAAARHPMAEVLDEAGKRRLSGFTEKPLRQLAERMRSFGKIAYQEALLDELAEDLLGDTGLYPP
ncbi:MAG: TIGR02679 family protein [Chloroflexota bacterium]